MNLSNKLCRILNSIVAAGGKPMIVGGAVRDFIMGTDSADCDVEVYGMCADKLAATIRPFGSVCEVGKAFGIVKLRSEGEEFDFSLPRTENKVGIGHKDYNVAVDPFMSPRAAAARRDFTMNSVYYDYIEGVVVDHYYGGEAIASKLLEPTSKAFKEDSLRILRGMQFAARFDMFASACCVNYATIMKAEYSALPKERVWKEWEKWAKGDYPQAGLQFLFDCNWTKLYPELYALVGCQQDPIWHPEGDAYVHTLYVCDAMARILNREKIVGEQRTILMMAALCHDFGKATTTEFIDGRWRSRGHCEAGVPLAESFLNSIGAPNAIIDKVKPLVAEHLTHVREEHTARGVRRLALRLQPATINELLLLIEADMNGRPPLPEGLPQQAIDLRNIADSLDLKFNEPKPIIMGRHLIEAGYKPGVEMGALLKLLFSAQLNGEFATVEEGLAMIESIAGKVMP